MPRHAPELECSIEVDWSTFELKLAGQLLSWRQFQIQAGFISGFEKHIDGRAVEFEAVRLIMRPHVLSASRQTRQIEPAVRIRRCQRQAERLRVHEDFRARGAFRSSCHHAADRQAAFPDQSNIEVREDADILRNPFGLAAYDDLIESVEVAPGSTVSMDIERRD